MSREAIDHSNAFRIRTITLFIPHTPDAFAEWEEHIALASKALHSLKERLEAKGYEVQTLRIATRVLSTLSNLSNAIDIATKLENLAIKNGITFLSLGATSDASFVQPDAICKLAAALQYTSFSVAWKNEWGLEEASALAKGIFQTACVMPSGNFRFCVAFNCDPEKTLIPYFPVAMAGTKYGFALGLENSGLLYQAFSDAQAQHMARNSNSNILKSAEDQLVSHLAAALQPLQNEAIEISKELDISYLGIDSSIAPALEPPTIPAAFELLGLGRFACCGTLAVAQAITKACKSVPGIKLTGYCGLMLPVCEDEGLAEAAANKVLSLQNLLQYSAVCGVGIDTAPVPGTSKDSQLTSAQNSEEKDNNEVNKLVSSCAALLLDTAALAFRLDKPLSVRLLPVPGGSAGDRTQFRNPYLVESSLMQF